jgi:hypothetical protein
MRFYKQNKPLALFGIARVATLFIANLIHYSATSTLAYEVLKSNGWPWSVVRFFGIFITVQISSQIA